MKCPSCGAENDPANRFCDQCGSRLAAAPAAPAQPQAASADVATAAAPLTCPNCGAAVLPGEAFCDDCGSPLATPAGGDSAAVPAPASYDAPTVAVPAVSAQEVPISTEPSAPAPDAAAGAAASPVCPVCGHQNLPGDRFCDNCGADLQAAPAAPTTTAPAAAAPTDETTAVPVLVEDGSAAPPPALESAPPATEPGLPPTPVEEPPTQTPPAEEPPAQTPAPVEAPPSQTPEPVGEPPAQPQGGGLSQADYEASRTRLEETIAAQQQIIAQLAPVQNALGAATPPGVAQSLEEARNALAQAQAEFDALQPPAPQIDPAEVARLQGIISAQRQIISQLEPVQNALGAATPPGVAQSLEEARKAVAQAEADLAALGGAPAPAPVSAPQPSAPAQEPSAAQPAAPPAQPAPASPGARLVIEEGGKTLVFPSGKNEIVVGREDPISGIFPEIDLTPFGGESGGVSRQHARINQSNGAWSITDLHSTNYTRLDGNRLEPNTPAPLHDGARLQFGRILATFHL